MSTPASAKGGGTDDVIHVMLEQKIRLTVFCPELPCFDGLAMMPLSAFEYIPLDGRTPQEALAQFTANKDSFRKTMELLAKSVSSSTHTVPAAD